MFKKLEANSQKLEKCLWCFSNVTSILVQLIFVKFVRKWILATAHLQHRTAGATPWTIRLCPYSLQQTLCL